MLSFRRPGAPRAVSGSACLPPRDESDDALRRLAFQVLLPLPERGEAVHHGAVEESTLTGSNVLGLARPRLLRRRLQRPAVAEGEFPRQAADLVHRVEVRRRGLIRLPA